MQFIFRADSNLQVGAGHVTRCSYLADVLEAQGHEVVFVSTDKNHVNFPHLRARAHRLIAAETMEIDAANTAKIAREYPQSVLVLDSYQHGCEWEAAVLPHVIRLVVWDDLANRKHDCHVLIDCGASRRAEDYRKLTPQACQLLIGPQYAPVNPAFGKIRHNTVVEPLRLHLFFGSTINADVVMGYYEELKRISPSLNINIALAQQPSREQDVRARLAQEDQLFVMQPLDESLKGCALALGSPGIATWERAYVGVVGFYVAVSSAQSEILRSLEALGLCIFLGSLEEGQKTCIERFKGLLEKTDLAAKQRRGQELVDGGGLYRIAKAIQQP